ncbi:MAG: S41 family peptidase [Candidatus Obscuribacterales bacterium]|nr:S41 family peptidase [Cyanobacteria bacterium SZAS LIN-5]RTL45232.1 MAG: S41 family peptidase [Candidatus Melainabacteria bacterium]
MKRLKRIGSLALAFLVCSSMMYQPAQGHRSQPQEVYHRAWQLVRDNYYESSFHNQNWNDLEHKYDSQIKTTADAHRYIKAMLETLNDPYTRFLDPRAFQDENDAIDARIVGIGINLQQSKDQKKLIVTRTIEEGPAETAGVRSGDEIIAIDNISAVGMTPEQAAEHIRGKAGTVVNIGVRHGDATKTVNITRQEIAIHAVTSKVLDNGIGYIALSTFISNDASREFRTALQKLQNADGLILDLRDNPGGLLSNALEIADMLLESGAIVSTISRHGRHTDLASGDPVTHQPIVVLVDDESASASEILAAALQDNGRGTLIGTHTYGKGLVQEINRLPGGAAVHITVSRYLTPGGSDINKVGVIPDINVPNKEEQIKTAMSFLKEKIASLKPNRMSQKQVRTSSVAQGAAIAGK